MNLVLTSAATLAGCLSGAVGGWSLRRAAGRWCHRCGQPVGTRCIECRDRQRAANLRTARNQRSDQLTDAT